MIHRPGGLADAAAWAEVVAEASPYLVQDCASETHEMQHDPPGARRWVVEDAGRVVALARVVEYDDEDHASIRLMTRPGDRRRGHARALLEQALDSGIQRPALHTIVEDDEDSHSAASSLGFELTRSFKMSATVAESMPSVSSVDLSRGSSPMMRQIACSDSWERSRSVLKLWCASPSGMPVFAA